ncbi:MULTISPECIES: hypothetical protein [Thiomicrorhabdus]|uniref:Outer membrane protein beta-barrel domain-containing protein n=1 Tax=Thiomicrorhabdus xiamenensis TaxID=2739063 RepID=A0A7D4P4E3_9GAMM|nr:MULTISPECIES: hypothetical protein [Thiomicrorhabdus]MBO1923568.1 hypothetical protein [Thiomicrorhabdus sp. 6S3-12]QKI88795.1 hypothetical protein HQN79_04045 [Thiomicrorhabdus xiamenensis]
MKKKLILAAFLSAATLAGSAQADATFMVGVSYTFSGELGFTGKILSNDKEEEVVATIGATYYPYSYGQQVGIDLGGAFTFDNAAIGASYDLIKATPQLSAGFADID